MGDKNEHFVLFQDGQLLLRLKVKMLSGRLGDDHLYLLEIVVCIAFSFLMIDTIIVRFPRTNVDIELTPKLLDAIAHNPAVALLGPRQARQNHNAGLGIRAGIECSIS